MPTFAGLKRKESFLADEQKGKQALHGADLAIAYVVVLRRILFPSEIDSRNRNETS